METIYCLACPETVWYVGRTTDCVRREHQHRCSNNTSSSKHIPKDISWNLIPLETVSYIDAVDAERFYIEFLEPRLNERIPRGSREETCKAYYQNNKDKCKESTCRWRENNPEKVKEMRRRAYKMSRIL
jgi:hypothetical protein